MRLRIGAYIIIICSLFAGLTYAAAAANGSLWGTLDEPVVNSQTPGIISADDLNTLPAAAPVVDTQKTTCEILNAQMDLSKDAVSTGNLQGVPDEYKALVATPDGMNELYKQYRDQYLIKYCGAKP